MPSRATATPDCSGVAKTVKKDNVESMLNVIKLHREAVEEIQPSAEFNYLKDEARQCWDRALARGKQVGYRNAQVTVLAPTGTIAFLMDCDTTGVEPDIALVKYKLLAGGGMLKIVNRTVPEGPPSPRLQRRGNRSHHRARREVRHHRRRRGNGTTIRSGFKAEHLPVFDCAFKAFRGKRSIGYLAHLKMMAAAQPFISGAISKTVNMPNDCTVEEIRSTYVEAWKMGLKCVAIYRDGSKRSQPLNTKKTNEAGDKTGRSRGRRWTTLRSKRASRNSKPKWIACKSNPASRLRRRLPDTRTALTHKFDIAGHEGYLTVGLFEDGQPGELFITMAKEGSTIGGLMDGIGT
jgi:ribonucleoside-diphosphate reductase alpha chain